MAEHIDVFISSTSRDLTDFRDAVANVILRLGMFPIDMANFNATDRNALQLCYDKLQEAEIFIGIYAHRYGYAPDESMIYTTTDGEIRTGNGTTSITHWEYQWAIERNLPMLLFVVDEDVAWQPKYIDDEPAKSRLKAFKADVDKNYVRGMFSTSDNLATQIATALAELKANLDTGTPIKIKKRHDFYKHVHLPTNYISRHDLLAELRLVLLGDDNIALTSAIKGATALHGMGGIGKSVLARALCDDEAIQIAYPDGILWTALGQEPDIMTKLHEWVHALGGKISKGTSSIDSLKSTLTELLHDKACLLIVDDVWQKKHGEAFRVGGERCRFLMTTRDTEVARGLGAVVQPIPIMSEPEAIQLLQQWADGNLDNVDNAKLQEAIHKLGRLPLAIKLAGAQMQRRTPDKWLERFDARKLVEKRADEDDPHSSLERCFGMSLSELKHTERKLYASLAIFKEDESIHEVAITKLWDGLADLDQDDAQDLLDDLAARALLEVVGDAYPRAAILHDLLRDFMAVELDDPQTAHQALLDAYAETQTADGWHTAPDDGYLYLNIPYHLKELGQLETIKALLLNYEWLQTKLNVTDTNALIADCDYVPDDETIHLIKSLFGMSQHILDDHKDQLHYQIVGRLWTHRNKPDIAPLWRYCHEITPLEIIETQEYPPMLQAGGPLLRTLVGHTDVVNGAIELSDGQLLSWSSDRNLRLWDRNGQLLKLLEGHTSRVNGAIELSDGHILSWSNDATLRLWDKGGQIITVLNGHKHNIDRAIELHKGKSLSWSTNDILRIWSSEGDIFSTCDLLQNNYLLLNNNLILSWCETELNLLSSDAKLLRVLKGHTERVRGALLLTSGSILSWAGNYIGQDFTLRIWPLNGDLPIVLEGEYGIDGAIELTNKNILSWGSDYDLLNCPLQIWSPNGKLLSVLEGHQSEVTGALELDNKQILSWSDDNTLRLWSLDGKQLSILEGHQNKVTGALELDNGQILSWSDDNTLRLWSLDGKQLIILEGHQNKVTGALELYNRQILSWSDDNTLRLWSTNNKMISQVSNQIVGIVGLRNNKILSWSDNNIIKLWSSNGILLNNLEKWNGYIKDFIELNDGRIVSSSNDVYMTTELIDLLKGYLRIWSSDGKLLTVIDGHKSEINGFIELNNGYLLSWSNDRTLRLWDKDGQPLAILENWKEDQTRLIQWADQYKFDVNVFKHKTKPSLVQIENLGLKINDVGQFIADANFTEHAIQEQTIAVGDQAGRVIFLRVRAGVQHDE